MTSSPASQNVEPNCGEIENKNSERFWAFSVQVMRACMVMLHVALQSNDSLNE